MKPRHRSDGNYAEIVGGLEGAGCNVMPVESPREGEPDLLVGFLGVLTLVELKVEKGKLSADQEKAHERWARVGVRVKVARTLAQAFEAVGITGRTAEENREAMRAMAEAFKAPAKERARVGAITGKLVPSAKRYGP